MGGSLEYTEIQNATAGRPIYESITNFVETGTYHADTTLLVAQHYDRVYTTEIVAELYTLSKERAIEEDVHNINFYLGDSVELLKEIVPLVTEGCIFFLDAHQSGYDTSNNGKQHVPLLQELDVILAHTLKPSVFIIDDLRLFDKYWDWAGITPDTIVGKFKEFNYEILTHFESNDRYYILTI